jgi:hypothetical protein
MCGSERPVPIPFDETAAAVLELGRSREFQEAVSVVAGDSRGYAEAAIDPRGFLEARGLRLPDGVEPRVVPDLFGKPIGPDDLLSIEFTNCRTYCRRVRDGMTFRWECAEVCLGIRLHWKPVPPVG